MTVSPFWTPASGSGRGASTKKVGDPNPPLATSSWVLAPSAAFASGELAADRSAAVCSPLRPLSRHTARTRLSSRLRVLVRAHRRAGSLWIARAKASARARTRAPPSARSAATSNRCTIRTVLVTAGTPCTSLKKFAMGKTLTPNILALTPKSLFTCFALFSTLSSAGGVLPVACMTPPRKKGLHFGVHFQSRSRRRTASSANTVYGLTTSNHSSSAIEGVAKNARSFAAVRGCAVWAVSPRDVHCCGVFRRKAAAGALGELSGGGGGARVRPGEILSELAPPQRAQSDVGGAAPLPLL
mmetsp:Transcript_11813/g.38808  ORF Transcript_11813/g.38808 Transcript_11813/m.38808 type:complete len:299 (+) Transcript_11813:317-1213(+)